MKDILKDSQENGFVIKHSFKLKNEEEVEEKLLTIVVDNIDNDSGINDDDTIPDIGQSSQTSYSFSLASANISDYPVQENCNNKSTFYQEALSLFEKIMN